MIRTEPVVEIPSEVLASPALLFLYYRIEQILGIRATGEALIKLNEYLEKCCGASFIEKPAAYEYLLTSREQIFNISKIVTINETYFFREGVHFSMLLRFLPQLAKLKRPIHICSAATSIGCEAYSIAMLLDYYSKKEPLFDYEIDAFDISAEVIETAKNARYTANTLRADGADWKYILDSYLLQDGSEYIVSKDICAKVHFFPHNIMRGFNRPYDVIFFRNALIYFSSKNRLIVLNDLAESLFSDGLLFLGVSETSAVRHPLLASRCLSDVFFFQKTDLSEAINTVYPHSGFETPLETQAPDPARSGHKAGAKTRPVLTKPMRAKQLDLPIDCMDVSAILGTEEGKPNAVKSLEILTGGNAEAGNSLSGAELAASILFFLGAQDYKSADLALSYLENKNSGAPFLFLRGEYHLLMDKSKDAELYFEQAAAKEKAFWPAFYRIASLAAKGNLTRYEYKIKKASESLELGRELHYECFMGGFSPDYFQRILSRRIQERKLPN